MKRFQLKRSQWLLIFLVGAVIVFLIGRIATRRLTEETIHIALIAPLTGEKGGEGRASLTAIWLFLEEFNRDFARQGGQVELTVYDSEGDPDLAEKAMIKVRNSEAVAVIGPHSNQALHRLSGISEGKPLAVVAPFGTDKLIAINNEWVFKTSASDDVEVEFLATYARQILEMEELNVVFADSPRFSPLYGLFEMNTKREGGKFGKIWTLDPKAGDDSAIDKIADDLSKSGNENPVALLLPAELAAKVVRRLSDHGLENRIIGLSAMAKSAFAEAFEAESPSEESESSYIEGCYMTVPFSADSLSSAAVVVTQAYDVRYGRPMTEHGMFAFDSAKVMCSAILDAVREDGTGQPLEKMRSNVRDGIAAFDAPDSAVEGITGKTYFDSEGNSQKNVLLGVYRNGEVTSSLVGQLQFLGDVSRGNPAARREIGEDPNVFEVGGKFYSETDVVYAGIEMLDILAFDPKTLDVTLKFYLWFRFRQGLDDATKIVFNNAAEEIDIGEAVEEQEDNDGRISYRLHRVEGVFKPNFIGRLQYGKPVIGVSFRNGKLPLTRIKYVIDTAGGSGASGSAQGFQRQRLNASLAASHRWRSTEVTAAVAENQQPHSWRITEVTATVAENKQPVLGNMRYLLQGRNHLVFSEFVYAMNLERASISIRNRMGELTAWVLLAAAAILLLVIAFEGRNPFLRTIPRTVLFFQIAAIVFGLLAMESVLLSKFDTRLHHYQIEVVIQLFDILWWLAVALVAIKIVARFVWDPLEEVTGNEVPSLIRRFVTGTILLAVSFCIIAFVFDYKITSLLASSGVAAMILGLALQINLSNIVSGIALNMDLAFKIGDWLKIDEDTEGKVLNIGWRATRIQTWDDCVLSIPNNLISESSIHNWSAPSEVFWLWPKVQIDPRHPPEVVKKILKDAVLDVDEVCKDPEPEIYCEIAVWSVDYTFAFAVRDYELRYDYESAVWESVWHHLESSGIDLGTESRELMLQQAVEKGPEEGQTQELKLLRKIEILQPLPDEAIAKLLANANRRRLESGEVLIETGHVPDAVFVIAEGVAEVIGDADGQDVELARLGPGTAVGEISFLTDEEPIATVRALTPICVLELTREIIGPLVRDSKDLVEAFVRLIQERRSSTEALISKALSDAEQEEVKESLFARILKKFAG